MKKIAVVLFVFVTVGLASCSKSDDNNSSIVGKWQVVQDGTEVNGEVVWVDSKKEGDCDLGYIEFYSNNTFSDWSYYGANCEEGRVNGTWLLEGNNLNFIIDSVTSLVQIEFTKNQLTIRASYKEDGVDVIYYTRFNKI